MPVTIDGSNGITTPMYNGSITANAVTPSLNMKNRIINGAMVINQRALGTTTINSGSAWVYTIDRWSAIGESALGVFTLQQSSTAPTGFNNSLLATVTTSTTPSSGNLYVIRQVIEGYNVADLGWGTANAKTVTLSFQVYSSLTGTFGGAIGNSAGNRSYPFTYTVSSANTWTSVSVTIAGDTSGTWTTTNGGGLYVYYGLGVGSASSGTAGAWAGALYFSATGATNIMGTNGATFYITGVQLEVGSTATSFDYRPYGTELALCQRYFQRTEQYAANTGSSVSFTNYIGLSVSAFNWLWHSISFPVTMRTSPTVTTSDFAGNTGKISVWNSSGGGYSTNINPYTLYAIRDGFSYSDYNNAKFGVGISGYIASAEL